jgi:hypothetical protein
VSTFTPPGTVAAAIASTLDGTCTISEPPTETFNAGTDLDSTAGATVYDGPCSWSQPKQIRRSTAGGDDRTVDARTVRLPRTDAALAVVPGHLVAIDGLPPLVVDEVLSSTHATLQRIRCVATTDAPGVPT